MNILRFVAVPAVFLTGFVSLAIAQSINPPPDIADAEKFEAKRDAEREKLLQEKWQVRIDVLMVSVPWPAALELLPSLRDASKIESACKQLNQMIAHKAAKLIAWPEVITKSGERAVTEGILEERYPTEFDPPQSPEEHSKPPRPRPPDVVPTAFETRNTGATLEVEPMVVRDGSSVLLNLVPQHVRLVEMKTHFTAKNSAGEELRIQQPQFKTMKTTTSVSLESGQRLLLATFQDDANDSIVFFVVHAEVFSSGK